MKIYYIASLVLFVIMYISVIIAAVILGVDYIVPHIWVILILCILRNMIICMFLFAYNKIIKQAIKILLCR